MLCIYIHIVSCKDLEQIYWMSAGKKSMGKALIGAGKGQHTVLVFLHILCARKVDSTKYFVPLFPPFYQKGRMLCHADSLYLGGVYLCYTSPPVYGVGVVFSLPVVMRQTKNTEGFSVVFFRSYPLCGEKCSTHVWFTFLVFISIS